MQKRTLINAVLLVLACAFLCGCLKKPSVENPSVEECLERESEISKAIYILDASCNVDADCKNLGIGSNWVDKCVNKNVETADLLSSVHRFYDECIQEHPGTFIGVSPEITCLCVNSTCTGKTPAELERELRTKNESGSFS